MRRFVKAMQEVTELLGRDEKQRLELIAEFTKMKPDLVQQLVNDDLIVKINPEALNLTVDLMTKDGLLRSSLDIRKYLWSHAPLEN